MRTAAERMLGSVVAALITSFSDDFNRTDGPVGNGWTTYSTVGAPAISGAAVTRGTAILNYEISRVLPFTPSTFQCDMLGNASGAGTHIFCGTTDGGSLFNFTGVSFSLGQLGGVYTLWTWVAGTATSKATGGSSFASGTLALVKSGNVYTGYANGVPIISYTGSGIENWGTSVAVGTASSTFDPIQLDNFAASV